ncbi:hypothetical protein [Frankia gtarii]|uniref:hypothetical protein n=1 Tax=Frankia gtarii TaxID=2950102 RepID=UPI0021BFD0E8|nr:hypothetical protein [Frankia gtarii]
MVAEGLEEFAAGLVGRPYLTSLFLRRMETGELGVAPRAGGPLRPVTLDELRTMLGAAGWRGGPIQVWAPSESAGDPAQPHDMTVDEEPGSEGSGYERSGYERSGYGGWESEESSFGEPVFEGSESVPPENEEPAAVALQGQLRGWAADLRTEFWLPSSGGGQRVVEGRLTLVRGGWRAVRPPKIQGERRLTPPLWLEVSMEGFLEPASLNDVVVLANGAASLTLSRYLDQLPFLRALDRLDAGIIELVLPRYRGGVGAFIGSSVRTPLFEETVDHVRPASLPLLLEMAGYQGGSDRRAVRLWTPGGPGSSEQTLRNVIRTDVLVLPVNSHGEFDEAGGGPRAVDADGEPTSWRVFGTPVDRGVHRWESAGGVARPRVGDAVARTEAGLVSLVDDGAWAVAMATDEGRARNDVFAVAKFRIRRDAAGDFQFLSARSDGSFRALSPEQMVDFLELRGWQRDRQALAVLNPADDQLTVESSAAAWEQVGRAAGAFVFGPAAGNTAAFLPGRGLVAVGSDRSPGSWEVLYAPGGAAAPLVTDPLGRLWPPQAPAWMTMAAGGLAAPDDGMVGRSLQQYTASARELNYPEEFQLDLPVMQDGRLGVTIGSGEVRPLDEVGPAAVAAAAVAAAAQATFPGPIDAVSLWTPPPSFPAPQVFLRDVERLAAAFGPDIRFNLRTVAPAILPSESPDGPGISRPPKNGTRIIDTGNLDAGDDAFGVWGFDARLGESGAPEFVVQEWVGTSRTLSPTEMLDYLMDQGWRPGQPIVVAETLRDDRSGPDELSHDTVTRLAWSRVGETADVFVFAPPLAEDVIQIAGYPVLANGERQWEIVHAPAGRPVPLVTDGVGRLRVPDAPAWLTMAGNGLAAPTAAMRNNRDRYQSADQGYPDDVFQLDLPLLPDGHLGVGFGDGTAHRFDEVGVDAALHAAWQVGERPINAVLLRTEAPAAENQYAAFRGDAVRLAAAFGEPVILIRARQGAGFDGNSLQEAVAAVMGQPSHEGRILAEGLEVIFPPESPGGSAAEQ